jgi:hypothetical protein
MIARSELARDDGGPSRHWDEYSGHSTIDDAGIANRGGGGMLGSRRYPSSFYPVANAISADKWSSYPGGDASLIARGSEIVVNQIDFLNGAARGFAYCYADPGFVIHGALANRLDRDVGLIAQVDGVQIAGGAKSWRNTSSNLHSFFDRDEYYFTAFEIYIDSVRGDV